MSCYLNSNQNCKNVQQCFSEKWVLLPFAFLTSRLPPSFFACRKFDSSALPVTVQNLNKETDKARVNTSCQAISYLTCHVTIG